MRRAFLIVGFNNWGKTTLVYDLFGKRRFLVGYGYRLQPDVGRCFTVESHSNDDTGEQRYIDLIEKRVRAAPAGRPPTSRKFSAPGTSLMPGGCSPARRDAAAPGTSRRSCCG